MAIMAKWARDWHIVRSDIDFKHVIYPQRTLTLEPTEQDRKQENTNTHKSSDCCKGCFKETFLRVQGGTLPDLATIAGQDSIQLQQDFSNTEVLKDIAD